MGRSFSAGHVTPSDMLARSIGRMQRREACSVFIATDPEGAVRAARAADERYRNGLGIGPLDGVPVSWKDLFDVAGLPSSFGSSLHAGAAAARRDAPVVRRLRQAGMVFPGKTNLSEFAFSGLGMNPHFGTPRNGACLDAHRLPGGSSSGAASSVALGIVPIAIGTDTSGSIRVPAAFQGLVGFKPSALRYCRDGVGKLAPTLDSVGTIARSCGDIALIDQILVGQSAPQRRRHPVPTLIVPEGIMLSGLEGPVGEAFQRGLDRLDNAGYRVMPRRIEAFDAAAEAFEKTGTLVGYEAARQYGHLLHHTASQDSMDPIVRARLEAGCSMTDDAYRQLLAIRHRLMRLMRTTLGRDMVICPTTPVLPPRLDDVKALPLARLLALNARVLRNTMITSFLDMPGLSLPATGREDDLPVGLMITAGSGYDRALLSLAARLETLLG